MNRIFMLNDHTDAMNTCTTCPSLCQSACPVFLADGNRSHSPWGLMQIFNQVRRNEIPLTPEVAKLAYHCTTCKACTNQCEHGVDVPRIIGDARIAAVTQEVAPPEIMGYAEKFHRHNNPFSKDLLQRLKDILPKKRFKPTAPVAYFATCTTIAKTPAIIRDTFELFDKLKIDFVSAYADPIQCCGYPLLASGAEYEFVDLAEINFHALRKHKLIITGSPTCAYTLKQVYARYDYNLDASVVTINEFLKPYLKNINYKLKSKLRTKLMYHDPCFQSRYLNESDLPREMIAKTTGSEPLEFHLSHARSACSGQGGCYNIIENERADAITKDRLSECREKNVNLVVTQCPTCLFKMQKNSKGMVIKDLVSYLNDCIEGVVE